MHGFDIRHRTATLLVVLALSTTAATLAVFQVQLSAVLQERTLDQARATVDLQRATLTAELDGLAQDLHLLARTPAASGIPRTRAAGGVDPIDGSSEAQWRGRLESIFLGLLIAHQNYDQVRFIGFADGGRELVRVDRHGPGGDARRVPTSALQRKGTHAYVADLQGITDDRIRYSAIDLNRERGRIETPHRPVVRASRAVVGPDGEPFGVLVINADVSDMFARLEALAGPGMRTFLTNDGGQLILHPDPARSFRFDLGDPATAHGELPVLTATLAGERPARLFETEVGNTAFVGDLIPLGADHRVALVLEAESTEATDVARATRNRALLVSLLVAAGCTLVGFAVAARTYDPIRRVALAMGSFDIDRDSHGIDVPRTHEASMVAGAFNLATARLRATVDELRRANDELEQFAYVASHDLQEPARTMHSFSGLLANRYADQLDPTGQQAVRFLQQGSARMLQMIRDLLTHSLVGQQGQEEDIDMDAVLDDIVADLQQRVEDSGATLAVDPLPRVRARPTDIRLLLQNLVANAMKFHRPGEPPRVWVRGARDGARARFTVEDAGVGIPADQRERLFRMFQRGHVGGAEAGSGIGLAHCRKIVETYGGRIAASDRPGGGTAFTFDLPAA